ncbi:MAG: hypothetical protein IJ697_05350 [Synergistaceae bacterium]|nr:hypothetical protein [Synergistaceae bacterium]
MRTDVNTVLSANNSRRYVVLRGSAVNKAERFEDASTEEALISADKIMNIYDETFRELAK